MKDLELISDDEYYEIAVLEGWKSTWEIDNIESGGNGHVDTEILIQRGRDIINGEIDDIWINYERVNKFLSDRGYCTLEIHG